MVWKHFPFHRFQKSKDGATQIFFGAIRTQVHVENLLLRYGSWFEIEACGNALERETERHDSVDTVNVVV